MRSRQCRQLLLVILAIKLVFCATGCPCACLEDLPQDTTTDGQGDQSGPDVKPPNDSAPTPGDLSGDGRVDDTDAGLMSSEFEAAFGARKGEGGYQLRLDLDNDGRITWRDLQIFTGLVP